MNPKAKRILQLCADNVFWVFLALMIILGSAMETPMINVGLTAPLSAAGPRGPEVGGGSTARAEGAPNRPDGVSHHDEPASETTAICGWCRPQPCEQSSRRPRGRPSPVRRDT